MSVTSFPSPQVDRWKICIWTPQFHLSSVSHNAIAAKCQKYQMLMKDNIPGRISFICPVSPAAAIVAKCQEYQTPVKCLAHAVEVRTAKLDVRHILWHNIDNM